MTSSPEPGAAADRAAGEPAGVTAGEPAGVTAGEPAGVTAGEPAGPAGADPGPGRRRGRGRGGKPGSFWRELPVLVVVALVLALLIKAFLVQAFYIPSGSMERTLLIRDRVLVNKLVYRFREPHRGEVVVFNGKDTNFQPEVTYEPPSNPVAKALRSVAAAFGLGQPGERDFIKRVIGLPGDVVACCTDGKVTVNGQPLDEPYVYENEPAASRSFPAQQIPPGRLWVMGDHRSMSADSRINGTIPIKQVVGRAFVKVWPVRRVGSLPVPATFHHVPAKQGALRPLDGGATLGLLALPLAALRRRDPLPS